MSIPGMVGKEMLVWVEKNTFHYDLLLITLNLRNEEQIFNHKIT